MVTIHAQLVCNKLKLIWLKCKQLSCLGNRKGFMHMNGDLWSGIVHEQLHYTIAYKIVLFS